MRWGRLTSWLVLFLCNGAGAECTIPAGRYIANWKEYVGYEFRVKTEQVSTELTIRYPEKEGEPVIDWLIRFMPKDLPEELYSLNRMGEVSCENMTLSLGGMLQEEEKQVELTWLQSAFTWKKTIALEGYNKTAKEPLEMTYDPGQDRLVSNGGWEHFVIKNHKTGSMMTLKQKHGAFAINGAGTGDYCHASNLLTGQCTATGEMQAL